MIVEAKCTYDCILSGRAERFYRGGTYKLDLNDLEVRKLVWLKARHGWIFDFDRANSSTSNGPDVEHKLLFCKQCGEPFESLNEIGTHIHSTHKDVFLAATDDDDLDAPVVVEKRGKKKKTFTCKTCGEAGIPNPYAMRIHKQSHNVPVVEPEAASV